MSDARCEVTGNLCGTDTWKKGYVCPCKPCQTWIATAQEAAPRHLTPDEQRVMNRALLKSTKQLDAPTSYEQEVAMYRAGKLAGEPAYDRCAPPETRECKRQADCIDTANCEMEGRCIHGGAIDDAERCARLRQNARLLRGDSIADDFLDAAARIEALAAQVARANAAIDGTWTRAERANAKAEAAERDAARWLNLLRGYRKMVNAVAPYFDKPLTDENIVHWLNLNNAGATIDAAISANGTPP